SPPPNLRPAAAASGGQPAVTSLRIDGVPGEVKVRLRGPDEAGPAGKAASARAAGAGAAADARGSGGGRGGNDGSAGGGGDGAKATGSTATPPGRSRPEELLRDIITLADEAARLAMGKRLDADETEEEGEGNPEEDFM